MVFGFVWPTSGLLRTVGVTGVLTGTTAVMVLPLSCFLALPSQFMCVSSPLHSPMESLPNTYLSIPFHMFHQILHTLEGNHDLAHSSILHSISGWPCHLDSWEGGKRPCINSLTLCLHLTQHSAIIILLILSFSHRVNPSPPPPLWAPLRTSWSKLSSSFAKTMPRHFYLVGSHLLCVSSDQLSLLHQLRHPCKHWSKHSPLTPWATDVSAYNLLHGLLPCCSTLQVISICLIPVASLPNFVEEVSPPAMATSCTRD